MHVLLLETLLIFIYLFNTMHAPRTLHSHSSGICQMRLHEVLFIIAPPSQDTCVRTTIMMPSLHQALCSLGIPRAASVLTCGASSYPHAASTLPMLRYVRVELHLASSLMGQP
ncbi:uncharacterized protein EDB91DRAFT_160628 [Suillus paluster]|uniref:uncharacterized protein n=1 Tax=Suillus paluster TaxID=48578 RepID=UPI001B886FD7|nr:uncharacterized protein EDB91DRAFT_160628 [Suillus paluster]KAG1723724.1 hypothetical protein EDB91DRAFT_160628 [Suillus paluster]